MSRFCEPSFAYSLSRAIRQLVSSVSFWWRTPAPPFDWKQLSRRPATTSITAGFRLKRGGIFVEARPGPGAGGLRVESPGRFVVLPDFFADDILIDAAKIPVAETEIPSENLLMHLTGDGNAIAMCVFENSDQDVRVTFEEEGGHRYISGSEIRFGEQRKIWVALLESPGIWHAFDVMDDDGGKIKPLSWRTPFAAQWRVDFSRQNDLVDSWEMVFPTKDRNGYVKASWTWMPINKAGPHQNG